jgi:hypothetical protein
MGTTVMGKVETKFLRPSAPWPSRRRETSLIRRKRAEENVVEQAEEGAGTGGMDSG